MKKQKLYIVWESKSGVLCMASVVSGSDIRQFCCEGRRQWVFRTKWKAEKFRDLNQGEEQYKAIFPEQKGYQLVFTDDRGWYTMAGGSEVRWHDNDGLFVCCTKKEALQIRHEMWEEKRRIETVKNNILYAEKVYKNTEDGEVVRLGKFTDIYTVDAEFASGLKMPLLAYKVVEDIKKGLWKEIKPALAM